MFMSKRSWVRGSRANRHSPLASADSRPAVEQAPALRRPLVLKFEWRGNCSTRKHDHR